MIGEIRTTIMGLTSTLHSHSLTHTRRVIRFCKHSQTHSSSLNRVVFTTAARVYYLLIVIHFNTIFCLYAHSLSLAVRLINMSLLYGVFVEHKYAQIVRQVCRKTIQTKCMKWNSSEHTTFNIRNIVWKGKQTQTKATTTTTTSTIIALRLIAINANP